MQDRGATECHSRSWAARGTTLKRPGLKVDGIMPASPRHLPENKDRARRQPGPCKMDRLNGTNYRHSLAEMLIKYNPYTQKMNGNLSVHMVRIRAIWHSDASHCTR
jgi:hypothetical protein